VHPETANARPKIHQLIIQHGEYDESLVLVDTKEFRIFMQAYSFDSFRVRDKTTDDVYEFTFLDNSHMKHYLNWNSQCVLEDITLALL
jgi:hypothetical protein